MKEIKVLKEHAMIPLNDLSIDIAQVRVDGAGKGIHDLARSIDKVGLLEPIVVFPVEGTDGYEILAGQRRFLACKELQWDKIPARIIERPEAEEDAKALSLHENWLREAISKKDEIRACLLLHRRYKNVAFIVEELGLPAYKVRANLKYDSLNPGLQKMVDTSEIDIDTAVRAQEAADVGGESVQEAIKYAKEMRGMSGEQRKRVVKKKKENPDDNTDEIIESAKAGDRIVQTWVVLSTNTHQALKKYAEEEKLNLNDAGASLIEESLLTKGFLPE